MNDDFEYLIYPHLSKPDKLAIGVRSVMLNANVCIRIPFDTQEILKMLIDMQIELESAVEKGKLVSISKDTNHICLVRTNENICLTCGKDYR